MAYFFPFFDFLLVNCQTNWGFSKEWYSTWKWEFGALVHYVVLTRLQSSSAGVSLGALRVLNNASYSLSRELISRKLSNQHWRAWRALKESAEYSLIGGYSKINIWFECAEEFLNHKLGHNNKGGMTSEFKIHVFLCILIHNVTIFVDIYSSVYGFISEVGVIQG